MSKKMCKHNRMSEVLPGLWIGGTKKHTEYTDDGAYTLNVRVVETKPSELKFRERYFVCKNYGVPDIPLGYWRLQVLQYNSNSKDATITVVTDLGGHGRSGLYCAIIMARVLGISGQEAIARLRQMHCEQAVETAEQESYVVRIADELRNWKG